MGKEKPQNPKKQRLTDLPSRWGDYGKSLSMAFQMGITIALGVWAGIELDLYFPITKFPLFTLCLSLLSIAAAMYLVIKNFLKK
jgi:Putative F0F1-ATPase subunit Ca2+/Mg2+ transporter